MDLIFDPLDARFDLLNIHAAVEFDIRGQQNMIRPQLHGAQVTNLLDRWICADSLADRRYPGAVRSFTDQQRSALSAKQHGQFWRSSGSLALCSRCGGIAVRSSSVPSVLCLFTSRPWCP